MRRWAALWAMTDAPVAATRPLFDQVFAEDATLINPWTVELSRESWWEGFLAFSRGYTGCTVDIGPPGVDLYGPIVLYVHYTAQYSEAHRAGVIALPDCRRAPPAQLTLFAVERTFACTNRETGARGVDEDWALGEVRASWHATRGLE